MYSTDPFNTGGNRTMVAAATIVRFPPVFKSWWWRWYICGAHLTVIINREYQHFRLYPRGCISEGDSSTNIFCQLLHFDPEKAGLLFPILLSSLWRVQIIGYIMACRPYTFVWKLFSFSSSQNFEHLKSLSGIMYSLSSTVSYCPPPDKMAAVSQTIFSDASSLMKMSVFWLKFHWILFLRTQLTIALV